MNIIDQVYAVLIYVWSVIAESKHIILGVTIAMTVSILKASRDKRPQNWGENLLCGVFAAIACTGLSICAWFINSVFNLPPDLVIPQMFLVGLVSGFVGFMGTDGTVGAIKDKFTRDKDDSN